MIDPDNPDSIERWENSSYNLDAAKVVVIKSKYFHGALGNGDPGPEKLVALLVSGAQQTGPSPAQQAAIDAFVANGAEIKRLVRKAIYDYYETVYPVYQEGIAMHVSGGDDVSEFLPPIKTGNELDAIVEIATIYVHPEKKGTVSIGIEFYAPWDVEHDLGVRITDGAVTDAGMADVAYPY
ncbi:DUF6985 domain-containing protein [Symmachiella macrocystis]|nr:hypothetical protein [Symmachiella macrocystis]